MARIAVAGFQHETNTFAAKPATLERFIEADAWPGLLLGAAVREGVAGINLALAGFIAAASQNGHEIAPLLWAAGQPIGQGDAARL